MLQVGKYWDQMSHIKHISSVERKRYEIKVNRRGSEKFKLP